MKRCHLLFLVHSIAIAFPVSTKSQCATVQNLGSATNLLTIIRNDTKPVVADKTLNTVIFVHRNNINVNGGNSGQLRYDISSNGGVSWTNDVGILNPINNPVA